jgi:DNA mismatch repair protein MutS2
MRRSQGRLSWAEMNQPDLERLDWPELLLRLSSHARSDRGRAACLGLQPQPTAAQARAISTEIAELVGLLLQDGRSPATAFPEIAPLLQSAEQGTALGAEELKQIASFCESVAHARRFFTGRTGILAELAQGLGIHDDLVRLARETFDATGEIRDSASFELGQLRRERDLMATRARAAVMEAATSASFADYLQDDFVTLREDRFVLPVKASFKNLGLGIVHATSRTGETVFIEPTEVVEINNRLKVAELAIRRECRRILEALAAEVAVAAPQLRRDIDVLSLIDVRVAMAQLAIELQANPVELVDGPSLELISLRHPLLVSRAAESLRKKLPTFAVVANNVRLGAGNGIDDARCLVISGPNAGGKTVLLKAVGLSALAARCGLHICAGPGSRIGCFANILTDIGDEQTVMGDLSTFSSHLANLSRIVKILQSDKGPHLVLCDEIAAGTNPDQGAALARATLEHLADGETILLTTTHYDALKALAETDERFRNAGMEYDLAALRPTFRLKDGLPGRSYALDVATIMGLPDSLLQRARSLVGHASLGLEEILRELELREAELAVEEKKFKVARADFDSRVQTTEQKIREKDDALVARERALGLQARAELEATVRQTRESLRQILRRARQSARHQGADRAVTEAQQKVAETKKVAAAALPESPALDLEKLRQALANRALGIVTPPTKPGKASSPFRNTNQQAVEPDPAVMRGRSNAVDVRGQRADEALNALETFLDRAMIGGQDAVFVIHGHGTGSLRNALREYLAVSPNVARFRPGTAAEGGDGVTVALLR